MTELLILGSDSTIGKALIEECASQGIHTVGTSRRATSKHFLDLTQKPTNWVAPGNPQTAILCFGQPSITDCENNPDQNRSVHVTHTLVLLNRLQNQGIPCLILSSSRVFGINPLNPPDEDEKPEPDCEYARQKAQVEESVLNQGFHTIVRLTKLIHPDLPLLKKWKEAGEAHAFKNLFLSPIGKKYTARALLKIAQNPQPDVAHLSAERALSYYEMAAQLFPAQAKESSSGNTQAGAFLKMEKTEAAYGIKPANALEEVRGVIQG